LIIHTIAWYFAGILLAILSILVVRNQKLAKEIKNHKRIEDDLLKSQDALNHKTAFLEAQLNSSTDGVMIIDEKGNRILQNKRVAEIWNIPEDVQLRTGSTQQLQFVMKMLNNPAQFFDQVQYLIEHRDATCRDIIELINGTVLERYSGPVVGKDGKFYGRIWTFHDVTEYLKVERLLAAEKELLSITLRSIGDGVITTDINGNILMINKVAQELSGCKSDEAVGQPLGKVFNVINEMTRQPCDWPIIKVLQTGEFVELTSTVLLSKNGSEFVISSRAAPVKNDEDKIIGVVLVFRDMTEELKLQTSIQKAQKLESLGVLAGGIAHDFNNLLSGIFGFLEAAKLNAAEGKTDLLLENLNESLKVFKRASSLTHQLLTFSKGGVPVLDTVHFEPLIKRCTQFVLSGSNIECKFAIDENLWPCDCDETQMEQVIDNIVINAKQAMPEGGIITISAVNIISDKDKKTSSENNRYVRISIRDSGVGIPKEALSKIFDPFYSTKEKGHGLGLATVFSIIKRHNGWIDVESEPGKGSSFHVFIPASTKKVEKSTENLDFNIKGSGTILIMDDEEFILKVFDQILEKMGFTCVKARNGKEAIELFENAEKSGKPFTACMLDLTVPGGMGGKEIVFKLRDIRPDAVIFAVSGYSDDPVIAKPLDHGFTSSIVKPFTVDELSSFLRKWLNEKNQIFS
jgi:PAS domain S-box-containing protein